MKLEKIMLHASCLNCRHYNKDENALHRNMRQRKPPPTKLFCPEHGIKDGICEKFLPYKSDVAHAIWRAKEAMNKDGK